MIVRTTHRRSIIEPAFESFGLLLLGLTGWAADRFQGRARPAAIFARLVFTCVTAVGWVVDRLPFRTNTGRRLNARTCSMRAPSSVCSQSAEGGGVSGSYEPVRYSA